MVFTNGIPVQAAALLWVGLLAPRLAPLTVAQCRNLQPCPVAPPSGLQDICYERGLTVAPDSQIVRYAGSSVTIYAEAHSSCTILPVVNGCELNSSLYTTAIAGNITYMNLTMTDISLMDSGLCISLHVKRLGISCNDTVCLTVIGPPPSVSAEYISILPTCSGIFINGSLDGSWPPNTTELIVVVQNQTYSFTSLPISINVSGFREHLPVSVIASNPAGKSRPYRREVNFINFNRFKLSSSDIYIYKDSPFINITVQVNRSCPVSVPQVLRVKSNCLSANVTWRLEEQTTYSLPLMPNRKRCYLYIEKYNVSVFSDQSTSSINDVSISDTNGSCQYTVNCSLLSGARGCVVELLAENGSTIYHSINRTTLYSAIGTVPLTNGNYTVNVYSLKSDGSFNHLVPFKAGIPLNCQRTTSDHDSDEDGGTFPLIVWIIIVLVLVTVFVITVILAVIIGTVARRNHRREEYDVNRQDDEPVAAVQRRAQPPAALNNADNEREDQDDHREPPANEREDQEDHREPPANEREDQEDEQRLVGGARDNRQQLSTEANEQLEGREENDTEQLAREENHSIDPQGTVAVKEDNDQSEREENINHLSVPETETCQESANPLLVKFRSNIPQDSPTDDDENINSRTALIKDISEISDRKSPQVAIASNNQVSYTASGLSSAAGSDEPLLKSKDIDRSSDYYQTPDTVATSYDNSPEFQCRSVKKSEEVKEHKAPFTFVAAIQRKPSITTEGLAQDTAIYGCLSHPQQPTATDDSYVLK